MAKKNEETAVTKPGLGMGGLGGFDTDSFLESVKNAATESLKGTATAEDIRDAMGNVIPKLEKVKVKHGGACLFQFEDETKASKVDELIGAVVTYTRHNTFFDKPFDEREEGERPPCFSNDGVTPSERAAHQEATSCRSCSRNRDATDEAARREAFDRHRKETCNNYLSLAVALPGREVPVHLQLSNTSFKPWAAYVQRIGTQGRFKPHEVATRFTLKNRTGAGGSEYSVVEFEMVGPLPKDLAESFAEQAPNYRQLLRSARVDDDGADAARASAETEAAIKKAAEEGAAL